MKRLQRLGCLLLLGRDRKRETVDEHVFLRDARSQRRVQNPLRDGDALLPGLGDSVFIHAETHHGRPVFFADREDGAQHLCFSVHGIHDGLAVHGTQPRFNRRRIRRVDLQRQIHHRLQGLHHPGHHLRLIDAGKTDIHVQQIHARVLLLDASGDNIIDVILPQGLLEAFLSGGVDALADDPHRSEGGGLGGGAHAAAALGPGRRHPRAPHGGAQRADKVRRGPAAAAKHLNPVFRGCFQLRGKLLRRNPVFPRGGVRQARIRFQDQRLVRPAAQLTDHGQQLFRPETAVKAHGIHTEAAQSQPHGRNGRPDKGPAAGLKGHRDPDRQRRVLPGREDGGLDLVQVAHGLDHDEVRSRVPSGLHDLPENVIGLFKLQGSQRLKDLPQGSDIQRDPDFFRPGGRSGAADTALYQFPYGTSDPRGLEAVDPEGVGIEDFAPRFHIAPVDRGHFFRFRHVPELGGLAHGQARGLQLGTHAAVQDDQFSWLHNGCPPFGICRFQTACSSHSPGAGAAAAGPTHRSARSRTSAAASGRSLRGLRRSAA